jgi:hypothetical protein
MAASHRLRALASHLDSASTAAAAAAGEPQRDEREAALADSAAQRELTGGAKGYRPPPLSPWSWDNELPPECIRWSFSNTRELTLTANVRRGGTSVPLPVAPAAAQLDLGACTFVAPEHAAAGDLVGGQSYSIADMLEATHTDCFLVL